MARSGYTLPVFAVAAAKAALQHLLALSPNPPADEPSVTLDLVPGEATIPIQQVAALDGVTALAITISDPGDNLDMTRNTPIWAWVQMGDRPPDAEAITLEAGDGLGRTAAGAPAIYHYARQLFDANLLPLLADHQCLTIRLILPDGRQLAQRTSNAAFGILEGLALAGTSGIALPHSSSEQLETYRSTLCTTVAATPDLIFCIGYNGRQAALNLGLPESQIVQTGNWIGALLVEAGLRGAKSIRLVGYQGKLLKLAGGIFNTSSHVADAKLEILVAAIAQVEADVFPEERVAIMQSVLAAPTADMAHQILSATSLVDLVFTHLAKQVSDRAHLYIRKYATVEVPVTTILCDRMGKAIATY
ncbi:MAG: cobalt-precorrin-5B (C(1))-methyltransferase [Cyanothece sp. SIO2G6]|nr:cobalt-precorrin-5B (C(1))-methyltransferase [Cyanothece sp. SIO2G6]